MQDYIGNDMEESIENHGLSWEEEFQKMPISDAIWRYIANLLVGGTTDGEALVRDFRDVAASGCRPAVRVITRQDVSDFIKANIKATTTTNGGSSVGSKSSKKASKKGRKSTSKESKKRKRSKSEGKKGMKASKYEQRESKTEKTEKDDTLRNLISSIESSSVESYKEDSPEIMSKIIKYMIMKIKEEDIHRRKEDLWNEAQKRLEMEIAQEAAFKEKLEEADEKESTRGKRQSRSSKRGSGSSKRGSKGSKNKKDSKKGKRGSKEIRKKGRSSSSKSSKYKPGKDINGIQAVNDEPLDGPQMYIALVGFYNAALALELCKLNVFLKSIIKTDPLEASDENKLNEENKETQNDKIEKKKDKKESRRKSKEKKPNKKETDNTLYEVEILQFWNDFQELFTSRVNANILKDVMLVNLKMNNLFSRSDSAVNFNNFTYDHVCYCLYDIHEVVKKHENYLKQLEVIQIPEVEPCSLESMSIYTDMVQLLSSETVSIPFILHCILEQVTALCKYEEEDALEKSCGSSDLSELDEDEAILLLQEQQIGSYHNYINDPENCASAIYIQEGDNTVLKQFHQPLPGIYLPEITSGNLEKFPYAIIWNKYNLQSTEEALIYDFFLYRCLKNLKGCVKNVELEQFQINLHLLLLDNLNGDECDNEKYIQDYVLPLSNATPAHFQKTLHGSISEPCSCVFEGKLDLSSSTDDKDFHCIEDYLDQLKEILQYPELQCQKSLDNISLKFTPSSSYNKYSHFKPMQGFTMLQVLQEAYENFKYLTYKYYPPTDKLILKFFNFQNYQQFYSENWSLTLPMPIGLKEFYEYKLPEDALSLQEVEEIQVQEKKEQCKASYNKMKEDIIMTIKDHLKQGLSKHVENENEIEENIIKSNEKPSKGKSKKSKSKKSSKSRKSSKAKRPSKSKNRSSSKDQDKLQAEETFCFDNIDLPRYEDSLVATDDLVIVFDVGIQNIKVIGRSTSFYSCDNSQVHVDLTQQLWELKTNLSIKIIMMGHSLVLHSFTEPEISMGNNIQFNVFSKCGCIISFNKHLSSKESDNESKDLKEFTEKEVTEEKYPNKNRVSRGDKKRKRSKDSKGSKKSGKGKKSNSVEKSKSMLREPSNAKNIENFPNSASIQSEEIPEEKLTLNFDMKLSLPSGLQIEVIQGVSNEDPFYIKQRYLTKGPHCSTIFKEDYRVYLRNGCIIIFMTDGTVKILYPNSTIVECKKFEWRMYEDLQRAGESEKINEEYEENKDSRKKEFKRSASKSDRKNVKEKKKNKKGSKSRQASVKSKKSKPNSKTDRKLSKSNENSFTTEPEKSNTPESFIMNVVEYDELNPTGHEFTYINNKFISEHKIFTAIGALDPFSGEFFTKRNDGVSSVLQEDGSLSTIFADGSFISSAFIVEEEVSSEVEDDVSGISIVDSTAENIESKSEAKAAKTILSEMETKLKTNNSPIKRVSFVEKVDPNLLTFLKLNTIMRHPNYATVTYYGADNSCLLKLTDNMQIEITANGNYLIDFDSTTTLSIQRDFLIFTCKSQNTCITTKTDIDLSGFQVNQENLHAYCSTVDIFGSVFTINYNGDTEYTSPQNDMHDLLKNNEEFSGIFQPIRLFVLNRDLSGQELLLKQHVENILYKAMRQKALILRHDRKNPSEVSSLDIRIFTPIFTTETENWIFDFKEFFILPKSGDKNDLIFFNVDEMHHWMHFNYLTVEQKNELFNARLLVETVNQGISNIQLWIPTKQPPKYEYEDISAIALRKSVASQLSLLNLIDKVHQENQEEDDDAEIEHSEIDTHETLAVAYVLCDLTQIIKCGCQTSRVLSNIMEKYDILKDIESKSTFISDTKMHIFDDNGEEFFNQTKVWPPISEPWNVFCKYGALKCTCPREEKPQKELKKGYKLKTKKRNKIIKKIAADLLKDLIEEQMTYIDNCKAIQVDVCDLLTDLEKALMWQEAFEKSGVKMPRLPKNLDFDEISL